MGQLNEAMTAVADIFQLSGYPQQRGDAKETTMVLYFGDVQIDAVDADHVAPYSIANPREREVPAPGLGPAVDHCHKRAEELEIEIDP